jgi:hypothetical protein
VDLQLGIHGAKLDQESVVILWYFDIDRYRDSNYFEKTPDLYEGRGAIMLPTIGKGSAMTRTTLSVFAGVVPLIAAVGIATSSDAQPNTSDDAYCRSLSTMFGMGHAERSFAPLRNDTAVAAAQCQEGDAESSIPVLEQRLRDLGYTLPPRNVAERP